MKKFIVIIILTILNVSLAWAGNHIIYIDLSSDKSSMSETEERVNNLLDSIKQESFLLFISNGTEPYICENENEVQQAFEDLSYGSSPVRPDYYDDIDTINTILTQNTLLSEINQKNRKIQEKTVLHFFLEPDQADYYKHCKYIVDRILFVNRLIDKKGRLIDNCKVVVNFDCNNLKEKDCKGYVKKYEKKYKTYEITSY